MKLGQASPTRQPLTQPMFFGSENSTANCIPGLIDEIKVYSGALPAGEIEELVASEKSLISGTSPYAGWAASHSIYPFGLKNSFACLSASCPGKAHYRLFTDRFMEKSNVTCCDP